MRFVTHYYTVPYLEFIRKIFCYFYEFLETRSNISSNYSIFSPFLGPKVRIFVCFFCWGIPWYLKTKVKRPATLPTMSCPRDHKCLMLGSRKIQKFLVFTINLCWKEYWLTKTWLSIYFYVFVVVLCCGLTKVNVTATMIWLAIFKYTPVFQN
jgi:hypothetical protein